MFFNKYLLVPQLEPFFSQFPTPLQTYWRRNCLMTILLEDFHMFLLLKNSLMNECEKDTNNISK